MLIYSLHADIVEVEKYEKKFQFRRFRNKSPSCMFILSKLIRFEIQLLMKFRDYPVPSLVLEAIRKVA